MIVAIVPAAGESRRMGRPKLTLDVGGSSVIARVVRALRDGVADRVVVVSPPADAPESPRLIDEARAAGAEVVSPPVRPADMRGSVEHALAHVADLGVSTILLIPADSPGVTRAIVRQVVATAIAHPETLVVPVVSGRRGHPIAMPWSVAAQIPALPPDAGINLLVRREVDRTILLEVDDPAVLADLDTPEDYAKWTTPLP